MKMIIIVTAFVALAAAYSDIDDSVDMQKVVQDKAVLRGMVDCGMDRGPCSKIAAAYKGHIVEMVKNSCANCDVIQKHQAHILIDAVKKNFPDEFKKIVVKYDTDGKHFTSLEKEIDKF